MKVVHGPKGEFQLAVDDKGQQTAIWEAYAHDFEDCELFNRNIIRLINALTIMRGYRGWLGDLVLAVRFGITKVLYGRGARG